MTGLDLWAFLLKLIELLRMPEAMWVDFPSDTRTSKNILYNANEVAVMGSWPRWTLVEYSFQSSRKQSNIPGFAQCKETVLTVLTLITGVCWEMSGLG